MHPAVAAGRKGSAQLVAFAWQGRMEGPVLMAQTLAVDEQGLRERPVPHEAAGYCPRTHGMR